MMNLINPENKPWMSLAVCAVALAGVGLLGAGCAEEEEPVAVAPPPPRPPAPPPAPAVIPVADLMVELNIDSRVDLPEDAAPATTEERRAVLTFFDAIARGNNVALQAMLPLTDQLELNALVESGEWKDTTSKIEKVSIQTGSNSVSQKCALAVIEVAASGDMSFQPQLWYYTTDEEEPMFEAAPTPPGIMDKLTGDWIATWHQILADEMAQADVPEEEYDLAQKNLDDNKGKTASAAAAPPKGGLRAPTGTPQAPPGIPGGGDGPRGR